MFLKKWDKLPEDFKCDEVKVYYDILNKKKFSLFIKRLLDIIFSLIMLIVSSPLLLILAIIIKIDSPGPVFFRQTRVTQYGRKFKIFKFRTMVNNADKLGSQVTVKNDSRITRVGSFIRNCRLDEVPQLINILIGDMTYVGTRPESVYYVDKYTDEMKATLLLPAGVTSTASIMYKDEAKLLNKAKDVDKIYIEKILPEKMKYNYKDIKDFNVFNDIKIIFKTVIAVFGGK